MSKKTCSCTPNECCNKCSKDMPIVARDLEVFHIDKEKNEAYIGYKIDNGNFHFINVPYTGKL